MGAKNTAVGLFSTLSFILTTVSFFLGNWLTQVLAALRVVKLTRTP